MADGVFAVTLSRKDAWRRRGRTRSCSPCVACTRSTCSCRRCRNIEDFGPLSLPFGFRFQLVSQLNVCRHDMMTRVDFGGLWYCYLAFHLFFLEATPGYSNIIRVIPFLRYTFCAELVDFLLPLTRKELEPIHLKAATSLIVFAYVLFAGIYFRGRPCSSLKRGDYGLPYLRLRLAIT